MKPSKPTWTILFMAGAIALAHAQTTTNTSVLIQTDKVAERTFTNQVPWTGTVQSQSAVKLTSTLAGRITRVDAEDETAVAKGTLLFELGGQRIAAERKRLTSEVDGFQKQLQLANQTVEQIQKDLIDHLATRNQLASAQQSALAVMTHLQEARTALESFEQQTRIIAPMDGVFTARRVTAGQQVNAGDPLAELVNAHHLRIVASLFPPEGIDLQNQPATVHLTDNNTLEGKVIHLTPRRSSTGAMVVWIEGPEIDRDLQPGRNVNGHLILNNQTTTAVPASAVVYNDKEKAFVFVPNGDHYERRSITTGQTADGWIEIYSGLKPGEKIVTQGAYELFYSDFTKQYKVQD